MNDISLQVLAGTVSSIIFMLSALPMLIKALRTKDMKSYSIANITLANVGNIIFWLYVCSLPFGPMWMLHTFNTGSTLMMLIWYIRYNTAR